MSEPASPAVVSPQKRRRTAPAVAVRKPPVVVANLEAIYDQPVGGRVSVKVSWRSRRRCAGSWFAEWRSPFFQGPGDIGRTSVGVVGGAVEVFVLGLKCGFSVYRWL